MNFDIRREEAIFIRDLIMFEETEIGEERLKKIYGDIDIEDIKTMFELIMDDSYVLTYRDEAYSPYSRPQVIEL